MENDTLNRMPFNLKFDEVNFLGNGLIPFLTLHC